MNEKLKLRCPKCQKLYEVEKNLIQSSSPHFECAVCFENFTFEYSENSNMELSTYSLGTLKAGPVAFEKSCPKCGVMNLDSAQECRSCQIVFEKYELVKGEEYENAKPHLVQMWKNYIEDYENPSKMENFLNACFHASDLDYAEKKIKDLHSVIGPDLFCEQALHRVHVYRTQVKSLNPAQVLPIKNYHWYSQWILDTVTQRKFLMWFPLWVVGFLLFIKWTRLYQGPVFGAVISILLLHFGIIFFTQGRIQVSDFFKSSNR